MFVENGFVEKGFVMGNSSENNTQPTENNILSLNGDYASRLDNEIVKTIFHKDDFKVIRSFLMLNEKHSIIVVYDLENQRTKKKLVIPDVYITDKE